MTTVEPRTDTGAGGWRSFVLPRVRTARKSLGIVTARGWGLMAAGAVALVLLLIFDWVEMAAIALVALVAMIIAVPFVIGRAAYDVRVELASERVVVGEHAVGRVVVRNTGGRACPANLLELPVGNALAEFRIPRLAPGAEHDDLFTIPTQRRAVLTLGPAQSVRTDPLGLLRRSVYWTSPVDLYVHPRVIPLGTDSTGIIRDLEGIPTRDLSDDDVSFHALREYEPGDDRRYVHWKSTARTQKMMIRQFEQTRRSHLVVALATGADEYRTDDEFELAVSIAGSVAVSALRDGHIVSLVTPAGALQTSASSLILDRLSAVEREATGGVPMVARTVRQSSPNASVVLLVTGEHTTATDIHTAAARVPPAARTICTRSTVGGVLARKVIGDVAIVDVPTLDSLRPAMRAASA